MKTIKEMELRAEYLKKALKLRRNAKITIDIYDPGYDDWSICTKENCSCGRRHSQKVDVYRFTYTKLPKDGRVRSEVISGIEASVHWNQASIRWNESLERDYKLSEIIKED